MNSGRGGLFRATPSAEQFGRVLFDHPVAGVSARRAFVVRPSLFVAAARHVQLAELKLKPAEVAHLFRGQLVLRQRVQALGLVHVAELRAHVRESREVIPRRLFAREVFVSGARLFVSALLKVEVCLKGAALRALAQHWTRVEAAPHAREAVELEV